MKQAFTQSVGLVMSGGGAKGLAHIGVLKALEDNNIPVDYIAGTSMGALVGGLYASGYSAYEIEYIALSQDFQDWVNGTLKSNYDFFYNKTGNTPSFVRFKLSFDSAFQAKLKTSIISDAALNFALIQLYAQASYNADNNFDSLMIPFRCVASDVFSQKAVSLAKGNLSEAIRVSMSIPFVYPSVKFNNRFLFDGGLYNNFPVDVMRDQFNPDIVIASNTSRNTFNNYPFELDDKLIKSMYFNILISNSDTSLLTKNDFFIQPNLSRFEATDFSQVKSLIDSGYQEGLKYVASITKVLSERVKSYNPRSKRSNFIKKKESLNFNQVIYRGLNPNQKKYLERTLNFQPENYYLASLKKPFTKLLADDHFETIFPSFEIDSSGKANFIIDVKPERSLKINLGGNISSRPIGNVYLGLQYNYFVRKAFAINVDYYSGRFYEAVGAKFRIDRGGKMPFYYGIAYNLNHYNYFKSSLIFLEDITPTFVDILEQQFNSFIGIPALHGGKLEFQASTNNAVDDYSNSRSFQSGDTLDRTVFRALKSKLYLEKNTLNLKQYPTNGKHFLVYAAIINGIEKYTPGTSAIVKQKSKDAHTWVEAKLLLESYYGRRSFRWGFVSEVVYTNLPFFSTYKETIIKCPVFLPLQDSRSIFNENLRAQQYAAGGLKLIFSIAKNLSWRNEMYLFYPYKGLQADANYQAVYKNTLRNQFIVAASTLVYQTPIGPIALSGNYYDDKNSGINVRELGLLLHVGFLLYQPSILH